MKGLMHAYLVILLALALTTGLATQALAQDAAAKVGAAAQAKVKKLIHEGGYYYSVGQLEKAQALADSALKLDPNSKAARELKEMCRTALAEREKNWVLAGRKEFHGQLRDIQRDQVPQRELLRHGENWPAVKKRTGGVYGPAAKINRENRVINALLDDTVINVDFRETPLKEAADFLANSGKVNIQVDPRAKVADKPALEALVTFQARNMKLRNVLAWITRLNDLTYTVRDEAVLITDAEHLEDFKVTAVYDISDITAPIPDYSSVPEFDITLPAINARRIGEGFYEVPYYWYWQGLGPFTGAYFTDFGAQNRYFMTEEEVQRLIEALIEGEERQRE